MNIVSTGQMRAQSISIQVSNRVKCNANCLACISRTTPGDSHNHDDLKYCNISRLEVGLNYAKHIGATHAILTGKADPTQENIEYLISLVSLCRTYIPLVDLHTNGLVFLRSGGEEKLRRLVDNGLTMITLSIASFDPATNKKFMGLTQDVERLIRLSLKYGLMVRCSLLTFRGGVDTSDRVLKYVQRAGEFGVHSVVVREIWIPKKYLGTNKVIYDWNLEHKIAIDSIENQFSSWVTKMGLQLRDPLPWGTQVFVLGDVFGDPDHGVNITFARCDDASSGPVIKSIVHKVDGHGYRNWDHNGDILY